MNNSIRSFYLLMIRNWLLSSGKQSRQINLADEKNKCVKTQKKQPPTTHLDN